MNCRVLALYFLVLGCIVFLLSVGIARADAIDATARLRVADGGTGTGTVFAVRQDYVWLLTCQHVVGRQGGRVTIEFWRGGRAWQTVPGRVWRSDARSDVAVVLVETSQFGGSPPPTVPLAPPDYALPTGAVVLSVGAAKGGWPTAFKGHATGYDQLGVRFSPPPIEGRSGSALLTEDGYVVGIIRARASGQSGETLGVATPVQAIYQLGGNAEQRRLSLVVWQPAAQPLYDGVPRTYAGHEEIAEFERMERGSPTQACPGGQCPLPVPGGGSYDFERRPPLPGIQRRQYDDGYGDGQQGPPYQSQPPGIYIQPQPQVPSEAVDATARAEAARANARLDGVAEKLGGIDDINRRIAILTDVERRVGGLDAIENRLKLLGDENEQSARSLHALLGEVDRLAAEAAETKKQVGGVVEEIKGDGLVSRIASALISRFSAHGFVGLGALAAAIYWLYGRAKRGELIAQRLVRRLRARRAGVEGGADAGEDLEEALDG